MTVGRMVGASAAIAIAIFYATGNRLRRLRIRGGHLLWEPAPPHAGAQAIATEGIAMTKMFGRRTVAVTLAVLVLSAGTVLAHHGVTGRYDTSRPIVLAGTVTQATFSPPHPVLAVRIEAAEPQAVEINRPDEVTGPLVARPEDVGQVREIELSPVRTFYDLGDRVRVGDRIMVVALRNCRPPNQLRSSWVRLSDGQVVSYTGGLHRRVDGCS